ncbi:SDR family oxidoreductase [Streptomyces sp. NPDC088261]|uniref:SDR family oxidoreductase n=1 Tax=Streptomyces sp. NPDC088261 TaxID=3365851 RepID=UPI0038298994
MTAIADSVVLVTGANGGMGGEFVRQALARGARKVYATARKPKIWDDERVVPLVLDVTDSVSVAAAAEAAGDTTIVVNNAAITNTDPLLSIGFDDVRALYETNVFGPLAVAQAFAPILKSHGGGALIDIHSALSWLSTPSIYPSTKSAFWSVTNGLRLELDSQKTQVLGAFMAFMDTPLIAELDVPKSAPADMVAVVLDALEAGALEVIADDISHDVKRKLSGPLEDLYPQLTAEH